MATASLATKPAAASSAPADQTFNELKRGALLNTVALITANFRGIFTFLVARLLGPAALGIYSVAWSTTDLLAKLGIFGLDDAVTTFVARANASGDISRARQLFRRAIGLGLVQSVVFSIAVIAVIRLLRHRLGLEPELVSALSLLLWAIPAIAIYRISTSVSRGMKVMEHDIYSRGITDSTVTTIAFLLALALGLGKTAPPLAALMGIVAAAAVALWLAQQLFRHISARADSVLERGESKRLWSYAAPISLYQFLNAFILRLDLIMLAWFVGRAPGVTLTTLGVYSAVVDLASSSRKINQAFYPIFTPIVAGALGTGQKEEAITSYGWVLQRMLWILFPIVAVMTLAGGTILLIYGPAFQQGALWLAIVCIACATNAVIGLGETIIMVQRPHLNLLHSGITCSLAVLANLWLIPRFGVLGAAFGILLPYAIQGVLRFIALRFVFHWHTRWNDIAPPIKSAAIAIVPALACRVLLHGPVGEVISASSFLLIFAVGWKLYRRPMIAK